MYSGTAAQMAHLSRAYASEAQTCDDEAELESARLLAVAEEKYRFLVERLPDVVWTSDDDGTITFVTANVQSVSGFSPGEISAKGREFLGQRIHACEQDRVRSAFAALNSGERSLDVECRWQRRDGHWIWVRVRAIAVHERDGSRCFEGMLSDITEKKQLEEALRQAQKMEAIGQLTGGIAHDFNNILAAILGNAHFLIEALDPEDPRRIDAEEIKLAGERAAGLTRQLLAFSRRQVLEPSVIDLNVTLASLEKMLRRLIGEDVEFAVLPGADLGAVQVDVGQIEQVIMNLAVNARDAMPLGGRFSIETANVELAAGLAIPVPIPPGRYVMIAVTDTGCGMDAETKARIFEPFFTTKELGKGTGLGLSTCHGIVKQSGGYIWVYSEQGQGTVFKIYLPRVDAAPEQSAPRRFDSSDLRGEETILLAEDDDCVRAAVTRMLAARGYRVLVARNGPEAIALAERHAGSIDLVLSDVIMPGSAGPEVVARVRQYFPTARVLVMSGYTDHAVLRSGALQAGMNFIQKPFAPEALALKVRAVLDAPAS